jgi:hypothetical protein
MYEVISVEYLAKVHACAGLLMNNEIINWSF